MILKDLLLILISILIIIIIVLVGVAFLTLLERKILGYIQIRKGPNKVGYIGILQPFGDAIKLFTKEQIYPYLSNYLIYYLSPIINLFLALILWFSMPFLRILINFNFSWLYFLIISSLGVYTIMLAGWASNRNYSILGRLRAIAQTISYEVSLALILLSFLFLVLRFRMIDFLKFQKYIWFLFIFLPLCLIWFVSRLAETNRTPFDFAEGESELVSGFNVEYSAGGFALIFIAEYSNILFMRILCSLLFLGFGLNFIFFIKIVCIGFLWVWVRGTLPRYRYDKLMYLAWKTYLPVSLNFLFFYFGLKLIILIYLI